MIIKRVKKNTRIENQQGYVLKLEQKKRLV